MKNATKHAETLKSLFKSLMKEGKPQPLEKIDPLKALVRGAMTYDVPDARAEEAMKAIDREFVNLNELRVATDLEIQELLGTKYPLIENRVEMITTSLNAIFEREHTMSLDRLRTINKREARQFLRELPNINPFVEAYVMLMGFEGAAVPVDHEMVKYLAEEGVLEETATPEEAQKFLEHNLKAEDCYDFFVCVRRAVHGEGSKGRKKAKV